MERTLLFKIKSALLVLSFLFVCLPQAHAGSGLDSLLVQLDEAIEQEGQYTLIKEKRIQDLKQLLPNAVGAEEKLELYRRIVNEYEVYTCDSAYRYSQLSLLLAEQIKSIFWINEGKLQMAGVLTISGMYPEAIELLNSVDKRTLREGQLVIYYTNYYHAYNEWSEFSEYDYGAHYKALGKVYRDSVLSLAQFGCFEYVMEYSWKLIEQEEYDKAKKLLFDYLPKIQAETREYAIIASTIAILHWYFGDMETHKEYLAISAICDIKAAIKENTSLRSLANVLFNEGGELNRANNYIHKSLNDANFYNARLRSIQISKLYPLIKNAYQLEREVQQKKLRLSLKIISLLSCLLLLTIVYILIQLRKLSAARKQALMANELLKSNNVKLVEANHIKEEYIGRFLNLCSVYIEKIEQYHRRLNKKAKEGSVDELHKMLKSNQFIEDELAEFYHNFDTAFLNLFPDFANQFNALIVDSEKVIPKQGEKLTTELRIFALIRLGITDSQKIAEFLRYSITTIYNYRSKYRNKSVGSKDEFENEIMKIGSF